MANGNSIPETLSFAEGLESTVRSSEKLSDTVAALSKSVRFTIAIQNKSGAPIQHQRGMLSKQNYSQFRPDPEYVANAIDRVTELGFKVVRRGRFGVTIEGPLELVSEVSGEDFLVQAQRRRGGARSTFSFAESLAEPKEEDLYVVPKTSLSIDAKIDGRVDHLVFTPPPMYFATSPMAPSVGYHNVAAADIRRLLNVPDSADGNGVKVGVVDSGFYKHPFYSSFDYTPTDTVSAPNADKDSYGHGTAITYNVFATAPGAKVLGFKQSSPPQDALEDAADAGCRVITCSWGWPNEQVFPIVQATLFDIISDGAIVLFAAGNGHYAWPASEPDVITVGGVYANPSDQLEASNFASGFMSSQFPGRRVPDVCGLCGEVPRAIYIVMPTQPRNTMDFDLGGAGWPQFDETTTDDGWVGASGTSSATPQVAGVVALMLQRADNVGRTLVQADIRQILSQSAVPITRGRNAMGIPAIGHPNVATGWGLVDATKALKIIDPTGTV